MKEPIISKKRQETYRRDNREKIPVIHGYKIKKIIIEDLPRKTRIYERENECQESFWL